MINSIERRLGNLIILGQEPVANQNPVLVLMGRDGRGGGEGNEGNEGSRGGTRRISKCNPQSNTDFLPWAHYVVCTVYVVHIHMPSTNAHLEERKETRSY